MHIYRVPLAVPYWTGSTYRSILRSILRGGVIDGAELHALKTLLIKQLGVADAVLCGSGSLALEIALRACGVRPADEVVIPTFCCSAVVLPVLAVGACSRSRRRRRRAQSYCGDCRCCLDKKNQGDHRAAPIRQPRSDRCNPLASTRKKYSRH